MAAGKKVKKLPMSLGDALDALRAGRGHQDGAAGRDAIASSMHYKRDEWEKFNATVTRWDLEQYWDYLP